LRGVVVAKEQGLFMISTAATGRGLRRPSPQLCATRLSTRSAAATVESSTLPLINTPSARRDRHD